MRPQESKEFIKIYTSIFFKVGERYLSFLEESDAFISIDKRDDLFVVRKWNKGTLLDDGLYLCHDKEWIYSHMYEKYQDEVYFLDLDDALNALSGYLRAIA